MTTTRFPRTPSEATAGLALRKYWGFGCLGLSAGWRSGAVLAAMACAVMVAGCQSSQSDPQLVEYRGATPVGTWLPDGQSNATAVGSQQAGATPAAGSNAGSGAGGAAVEPATSNSGNGSAGAGAVVDGGAAEPGIDPGGAGMPASGAAGSSAPAGAALPTSMTFEVLTVRQGGEYEPRNIGAIWIADAAGNFVKTLEVWARERRDDLTTFEAETGSNMVDAVAGATLRSHVAHRATWDLTDVNGNAADPGSYTVVIEVTDKEDQGATAEIRFASDKPVTLMPPDQTYYKAMRLVVQ